MRQELKVWTVWDWEHWRKICDPSGHIRWLNIAKWQSGNVVTDEGINHFLNSSFYDEDEVINDWYIAVFEDDYTPLVTDTYAVPGYTECITFQESSRPSCQFSTASGKQISNVSNKSSFTFSLDKTIYGSALIGGDSTTDADVLGNTDGGAVLFCASKFVNGSQGFLANDVAKVTCTINMASG